MTTATVLHVSQVLPIPYVQEECSTVLQYNHCGLDIYWGYKVHMMHTVQENLLNCLLTTFCFTVYSESSLSSNVSNLILPVYSTGNIIIRISLKMKLCKKQKPFHSDQNMHRQLLLHVVQCIITTTIYMYMYSTNCKMKIYMYH